MKAPGIFKGITFAIVASLTAGFLSKGLPLILTSTASITLILCLLALAYLLFLFRHSPVRRGHIVALMFWIVFSLTIWLAGIGVIWQLIFQLSMLWILRCLYFHHSIISALLDLVLVTMATGAACWALFQTGSLMAAVWCFFLSQSLFAIIPERSTKDRQPSTHSPVGDDRFQSAYRIAEQAVRKLTFN